MREYLKSTSWQRLLRHPRSGARARGGDGGRGASHHQADIGNPAPFGFEAPDEILIDVIHNIPHSQGYSDSRGLYSRARR